MSGKRGRRGRSRGRSQQHQHNSSQGGHQHSNHSHSHSNSKHNSQQNHSNWTGFSPGGQLFRKILLSAATSAAAKFTSSLGDDNDYNAYGTAGNFDLYLFAQSWAPRFCCTSTEKCRNDNMHLLTDLSTHGLWPAYTKADQNGRTYPAFCTGTARKQAGFSRAEHEWAKHGTCSGLTREAYFQQESALPQRDVIDTAECLRDASGDAIELEELWEEYGSERVVAFKADKFCRLEEITTCFRRNADGTVGDQVECPEHVLASQRNSAVLNGCSRVWLDSPGQCKFIDKELLHAMKSNKPTTKTQEI
eukprot:TRINITY_DN1869_c1_g1_i1.p1 TRINITY_DN1869_c1_g1~~TRINITY_DN1869_c1_g1_i1.p1  ORF type:complete len:305 (+),score=27.38 TRINITY_DN1869_c1_g1_i1:12-926(+)